MKRLSLSLAVLLAASWLVAQAPPSPDPSMQSPSASSTTATAGATATTRKITAYTLPPDIYQKAHDRNRIHFRLALIGFVYGVLALWLTLKWKISPKYRDWAERFSKRLFLQSLLFAPLLLLTVAILTLPLDIYSEMVEKRFGISVQSWGSWTGDWLKGEMIALVAGIILVWLLYVVIRWSPRFWWFHFWLITIAFIIFVVFIQPWVIDPMFHKFESLQQKDPELTASLERMVQRAGQNIPPERMYWMGAGEKTTSLNAYVNGIGASKRIVVWDNTIAKMNTPQIVYVAGHEMGHYVLLHIPKMLTIISALLLVFYYLGYLSIGWVLARWGGGWGVRGVEDLASLPALMLLLTIMLFISNPVGSAISRHYEHQADQYGLEVTHGLTPDSNQVAAQAFQVLGEVGLSDPDPNPVNVFMFYDHPTISDRLRFCLSYDPWANGGHGEFVK